MNIAKLTRRLVLIVGPLMAGFFTLWPILTSASGTTLAVELSTGAGLGWVIASLPYWIFWQTNHRPIRPLPFYAVAALLIIGGATGLGMMLHNPDPQGGIAYALYLLPLQYSAVIGLYLASKFGPHKTT